MRKERLKENSRKYFDEMSEKYELITEPALCYSEVLSALERHAFRNVVDVGCGTGKMLELLREKYGAGLRLYGIDLSPRSAEAARKNNPEAEIITGDAEDMPYEGNRFDMALCLHSFHHYPDPDKALREIYRILRKTGGSFILVENYYFGINRILKNIRLSLLAHHQGDVKRYSEKELTAKLEKAGFSVLGSKKIGTHSILIECRV